MTDLASLPTLIAAFVSGFGVGFLLALVVIPGAVDRWVVSRRCADPDGSDRRRDQ
jgi:hypothetical protein